MMEGKDKDVVIIGKVWVESASTAAGSRMLQIMELLQEMKFSIHFWTAASPTGYEDNLEDRGISCRQIKLNHSSFDDLISELNPAVVIYDRFMTEEQFGWRVRQHCPDTVQVLDTEDLHFLREARLNAVSSNRALQDADLFSDTAKREIGSILRCDLSLIISGFEMNLLTGSFNVPESQLLYLPFLVSDEQVQSVEMRPGYSERKHFVSIGNFLHEPNWKAVLKLRNLWPDIRAQLPEAECHIYGAYLPDKARQLHSKEKGFQIKGRAESATGTIQQYKALLAPVTAGAGLKGKFIDAMLAATPSVTTPVGAEGMQTENFWPGFICKDDADFINNSVRIYRDENEWKRLAARCEQMLAEKFGKQNHAECFDREIAGLMRNLSEHRTKHFTGQILNHSVHNYHKFFSRWIELKNNY